MSNIGSQSQSFREHGHRLIDQLADYLAGVEDRALFPRVEPRELTALFAEPVPRTGESLGDVFAEVEAKVLPYCTHVSHPGYFGLITPTPTPAGILADLLASALNQNPGAWTLGPSAVAVERQTVRWLCDLIGYGGAAGGNLTSGGMMANFVGMKLGRDRVSGDTVQRTGIRAPMAAYTSEERHVAVDKAADAIGIGRDGLRILPTDGQFRLRIDALEAAIARDRAAGIRPMCIVAMGGSTNTGAVDDLATLRRIADREGMWLHVDAAYGGGMLLSKRLAGALDGLAAADSVTIDPHKWFYAPLDAGAVLVKDATCLTRSFGMKPAYLTDEFDVANERYNYYVHSFEQSRRFRALKVWMSLKHYGADEIGRWVEANVAHAARLYRMAKADPRFVPAVEPVMSAVCLRWVGEGGLDGAPATRLHAEVAKRVEESGRFWIGTTELKGRTWFRVNPVNVRTRDEHIDALFGFLGEQCAAVDAAMSREASSDATGHRDDDAAAAAGRSS